MASTTTGLAAAQERSLRFWNTTIGKKAVMAVSGVILAGFVAAHLLGNLQIFLGPDRFNGYARTLKSLPELLWAARITLLISVILHIWSSIQLAVVKSDARPVGYVRKKSAASTYASRTMYWSGPIVAAFIIYHLMQFTLGVGGTPYMETDPYGNVINGFRVPAVALFYIIAMGLLCLHLRHGLASIVQSLGFHHPRYTPRLKTAAAIVATLIFFGFVSIPVAVLTGLIPTII
jgi:succinate dehydrogenase / fumarate reductase cytochrome b subunit